MKKNTAAHYSSVAYSSALWPTGNSSLRDTCGYGKMLKISWVERVKNEEVLCGAREDRNFLSS